MNQDDIITVHCRCTHCDTCNHIVLSCSEAAPDDAAIVDGMHIAFGSEEFVSLPRAVLKAAANAFPILCANCEIEISFRIVFEDEIQHSNRVH